MGRSRNSNDWVALLVTLSITVASLGAWPLAHAQSIQLTTGSNEIQYFNTSLHAVRLDNAYWKQAFDSMAQYQYRPDIISVLEVPWSRSGDGDADRDEVMKYVEDTFGVQPVTQEYGSVHVDGTTAACQANTSGAECGNTMIVYRLDRFTQQGTPLRWKGLQDDDATIDCTDQNPYVDQLAVSLQDKLQIKTIVAVGLHLDAQSPKECTAPNLKFMNDKVEQSFSNRPMTILSGDFNEHPDPRHSDPAYQGSGTLQEKWRQEQNQACWYKRISQYHSDNSCSITVGAEFSFPYYDAVWTHNTSDPGDICDQWTFNNEGRNGADDFGGADSCTSDQKRIDYLWVRYEKASTGTAITPSSGNKSYPQSQIAASGTDDGLFTISSGAEIKYSDHRIIHARFYWCGPNTSDATPCTP